MNPAHAGIPFANVLKLVTIVTIMVTIGPTSLSRLLGRTRSRVLGLMYSRPTERFHVRQIARLTEAGIGGLQRELGILLATGLLVRQKEGVQVYYQANAEGVVFEEMKGLVLKTMGVGDVLRAALAPLHDEILAAWLFGSLARGQPAETSDVDVLIISDTLTLQRVVIALRGAEQRVGREINPVVYRRAEFKSKLSRKQAFVTRVMSEPKLLLAGDAREFG